MKKVLVTGGGGFVGGAIVSALLEKNVAVVVLGRQRYAKLLKVGVQCVVGDIADKDAVLTAADGCDTVFHVAAKAGIWGSRKQYFATNVVGTENVISACRAHNIKTLVYTSTPSVVFDGNDLQGVDETTPYGEKFLCHYAESKAVAEQKVLAANCDELRTVALRPHLIWGPGDTNLIPRIVERAANGRLQQVGDGSNMVDISYIDNVVSAHLDAALELCGNGVNAGNAYFIAQNEPVNLWGWINDFLAAVGVPLVTKKISFKRAYRVGAVFEFVYKMLGINSEPLMSRFLAEQLAKSHRFSIAAAKADFGYQPQVATEEGMKRLVKWLQAEKM